MNLMKYVSITVLALILIVNSSIFNSCSKVTFAPSSPTPGNSPVTNETLGNESLPPVSCVDSNCTNTNPPCTENCEPQVVIDPPIVEPKLMLKDYIVPKSLTRVDIFLVIDNSASMSEEHKKLAERMQNFLNVLNSNSLDWQICYTTSQILDGNGRILNSAGQSLNWYNRNSDGSFTSISNKVLTPTTPDLQKIFSDTMTSISYTKWGEGNGAEQPIAAMNIGFQEMLNSNCFRPDAKLISLTLTDEDENSCGGRCENKADEENTNWDKKFYTDQYRPLETINSPTSLIKVVKDKWPNKNYTSHSISILKNDLDCFKKQDLQNAAFYGITHQTLSQLSGGKNGSICDDDYTAQLSTLGEHVVSNLNSIELDCPISSIENIEINSDLQNFSYDIAGNKINFTPALPENTHLKISYYCSSIMDTSP